MTTSEPLNFFTLEASECIERLDVILHAAGASASGPSADDFVRAARTLRGAATMHRLSAIADLAAALERAGRALRAGELRWTAPLSAALTAAVDDLKILVHKVRGWSPTEDARSARRVADLARYLPAGADAVGATATAAGAGADQYFASETTEIALALDAFAARPSGRGTLAGALARVRTLRGVAAVNDRPPLPEVLDAVERVGRSLELDAGTPGASSLVLLTAAAQLLRRVAGELRAGNVRNAAASVEYQRFASARAEVAKATEAADRIVPIDALFPDDGADGVIDAAPSPPTTPAERFRLEVVSQAEHLRSLLAAGSPAGLRSALRAMRSAAESFGEREVSVAIGRVAEGDDTQPFASGELASIRAIADVLADPSADARNLAARIAGVEEPHVAVDARALEQEIALGLSDTTIVPEGIETEASLERLLGLRGPDAGFEAPRTMSPGRERTSTPTGKALHAFLQNGISEIERKPIIGGDESAEDETDGAVVPIDSLLYRGRSALDRARVVRDEIRAAERAGATPRPESLSELLDLIDLAATA